MEDDEADVGLLTTEQAAELIKIKQMQYDSYGEYNKNFLHSLQHSRTRRQSAKTAYGARLFRQAAGGGDDEERVPIKSRINESFMGDEKEEYEQENQTKTRLSTSYNEFNQHLINEKIRQHSGGDAIKAQELVHSIKNQMKVSKVIELHEDIYSLSFYGYYIESDDDEDELSYVKDYQEVKDMIRVSQEEDD